MERMINYDELMELRTKRMLLDAEKAYNELMSVDSDEVYDFIDNQLKAA
jgi:hypothetical protein